jgi:flagellin-like protein
VFTDEDGNPSTPETYTIPINFELDGVAVATADLVLTEGDITGETIVNALYTGTPLSKGVHTYRVYFADQKETTGELFEAHDSTVGTNNNEATIELEVIKPGARASQSFAPPIFIVLLILGILAVIYSIFAYPQYRRLRLLLRRDREGVSPVIAVILMVGITIIIIAILWMWIYSFIPTAKETPERYDAEVKLDDNGDYTIMIKTAKKPVSVLDCRFYLKDPTGKTMALPHKEVRSIYNKELTPTYPVVYHDNDLYGKISTHDTFEIRGLSNGGPGQPDGKLILVYKPTGGIILEARLQ